MINVHRTQLSRTPKRKSGFVYTPIDPKVIKQHSEQSGGRFDSPFKQGFDTFRAKVGSNQVRILPPTWEPHDYFSYELWMHGYIGTDGSSYLCLNKMLKKPCPICEAAQLARRRGDEEEERSLKATAKYCPWIIDRDGDETIPILWPMSWTLDKDISSLTHSSRTGKTINIDHPDAGYDIVFNRTGQKLATRYSGIAIERDDSPINDDQKVQDDILDFITENPVPTVLNFYEADYLDKILMGTTEKEKEEDEEEEAPRRRTRTAEPEEEPEEEEAPPRRRAARTAEPEEEIEEEGSAAAFQPPRGKRRAAPVEEDEEEVPFEEDEAPPPRAGRKRAAAEDEPEEEAPPRRRVAGARRAAPVEEEEPEEEAPRRRRAAPVEEEEPEEVPPRRRARAAEPEEEEEAPRRRRAAPVEEEEEIVEEADEEEETPPRRRATARRR